MKVNKRTRPLSLVVFFGGLLLLAINAAYYWPFLADDALISLRYSQRLVEGYGLTWTAGRPVEGYSNLLWVLLCAALGAVGVDWVATLRVLGLSSSAAAIAAVVYAYRAATWRASVPMITAAVTVALAGPVGVWAIGGLEPTLVLALLAWATVLLYPAIDGDTRITARFIVACFCFALQCLTRPDGALFTAAAVAGLVLVRIAGGAVNRPAVVQGLLLTAIPASFYLGQLAFRLWYYGDWVPNTAYAKLAHSVQRSFEGALYVLGGFVALAPLSFLAAWYAGRVMRRIGAANEAGRNRVLFLLAITLVWAAYVVFIGGDIFPGRRHLVPLVAPLALLAAEAVAYMQAQGLPRWSTRRTAAAFVAMLGIYAGLQFFALQNRRALFERWEWDGKVIGLMLKQGFSGEQPVIAVTAAGCLPFWSELPALDMLGLNDYYLARNRPESFGDGYIGHELGDGEYIFEQRPDVIIFNGPDGGPEQRYRSGLELLEMPAFHDAYTLMTFEGRAPHTFQSDIYVLRDSDRIGIARTEGLIHIPAYFLSGNPESAAYVDGDGFVIDAGPGQPAIATDVVVPGGDWTLEPVPDRPGKGRILTRGKLVAEGSAPLTFRLPTSDGPARYTISFEPEQPTQLRALRLRRVP